MQTSLAAGLSRQTKIDKPLQQIAQFVERAAVIGRGFRFSTGKVRSW